MLTNKLRKPRFGISKNDGNATLGKQDEPMADILIFIKNASEESQDISADAIGISENCYDETYTKVQTTDHLELIGKQGSSDHGERERKAKIQAKLDEGIAALEPHLAAYRKRLNENEVFRHNGGEGSAAVADDIPPQLLRVVRFFPFKWMPMKYALLRPPSKNEVGKTIRLSLARELYQKGLLISAEFDILEQSIHAPKDDDDDRGEASFSPPSSHTHYENSLNGQRKRDTGEVDSIYNDLKMSLSRLPLDTKNLSAVRHMKTILYDYCERLNEDTGGAYIFQSNEGEKNLPSPAVVSEWALMAFSSVVIANGLDEPKLTESEEFGIESQIVQIFTKAKEDVPKYCYFTDTLKQKIKEMLIPPLLDKLSNLNILCLARFCSYIDTSIVEEYIANSLNACHQCGGGSGLAALPKLLASYISIMSRRNPSFSHALFETGVKKKIEYSQKKPCDEDLRSVIFTSSHYLIKEASSRMKNK